MLEQQIEQWIAEHQEEMVADIEALVRHKSISQPSDAPYVYGQGCADALEEMLKLGEKYGFDIQNADYRCGIISYGSQEGKTIGLWGHLDVVPEGNGWVYPPYECTRKGDFLIGRGVQDNKGPSVAALYAMRCIKELGLPLRNTIRQIVGCAEETGMDDVAYFVNHFSVPDFNIITDCGFPVCYGEKGIMEADLESKVAFSAQVKSFFGGSVSNIVPDAAEITLVLDDSKKQKLDKLPDGIEIIWKDGEVTLKAKGLSKHAAFPEGSINAIEKLCAAVLQAELLDGTDRDMVSFIHTLCSTTDGSALKIACSDELSGALTCVGGVLRLKDGHGLVSMNIRYPIFADSELLKQNIRESCEANGFSAVKLHDSKPNYFDKDSVYVQCLNNTYNEIMKLDTQPFVMGGGTYARKIPNAVAFGPGLPMDFSELNLPEGHGNCHCPDEVESIENLMLALKIYVLSLLRLDQAMD